MASGILNGTKGRDDTSQTSIKQYLKIMGAAAAVLLTAAVTTVPVSAQMTMTFTHPGVLLSQAQLAFLKQQVNRKVAPFFAYYQKMAGDRYASLHYAIQGPPVPDANGNGNINIQCGSESKPDFGCNAADADGAAAYVQAILWYITGNQAYANNAISILNAYSHVTAYILQGPPPQTDGSNGPLQAAWDGEKFPRAAEILAYTNSGWQPADIAAFKSYLENVIVGNQNQDCAVTNPNGSYTYSASNPNAHIYCGSGSNGNWELSMIEAMINIAVFSENTSLFNHAVAMWQQRVPAYAYNSTLDGTAYSCTSNTRCVGPIGLPRNTGSTTWNGQLIFNTSTNGVTQETCRDLGHTEFGLGAAINAAETAHIQGVDLYGQQKLRLETALELQAQFLNANVAQVASQYCSAAATPNTVDLTAGLYPTLAIAYNHYHNRLGDALPNTGNYVLNGGAYSQWYTPAGDDHMIVYELFTHAGDAMVP